MYLYLVRHGEALSKEEDPERGLSPEGITHISHVAAGIKGFDITVKKVFHSGKKRAMQTALIFSESVHSDAGVLEADGLSPMDDPRIWHERISGMNENLMLVGHLPQLAKLSSLMLCGSMDSKVLDFAAGSIVCMLKSDDVWSVNWMTKPGLVS